MAIPKMDDQVAMSDAQLGAHLVLIGKPLQIEWEVYLAGMRVYQAVIQVSRRTSTDAVEQAIAVRVNNRVHSQVHTAWRAAVSEYYGGERGSMTFSDVNGVRMVSYHVGGDVYGPAPAVKPPY